MDSSRTRVALQRVSTVDALAGALRDEILDGTLRAGTPLREADLTETFGVSRHTVRTALQVLTHEGIVRHEPNRGAYVPDVTTEDVVDVFQLRTLLECHAVRQLAMGRGDMALVRGALDALRAIGPASGWAAVRDADLAFHRALVDSLGSERISRTYGSLLAELRLCFRQLRPELEDQPVIVRQHDDVLRALESADGNAAAELIEEHLRQSLADIMNALPTARHVDRATSTH